MFFGDKPPRTYIQFCTKMYTVQILRLLLEAAKSESALGFRDPSITTIFQCLCLELDEAEFLEAVYISEYWQDFTSIESLPPKFD